ncbi:MAG: DUF302 domain-containing protein [Rhodothermales bacterium]
MHKYFPLLLVLLLFSCTDFVENQHAPEPESAHAAEVLTATQSLYSSTDMPGLTTTVSEYSVSAAFDKLDETVTNNPNLRVILRLDHSGNAAANGLDLRPTKLLVFGNPNLGTPLMQRNQFTGLDLPQKVLFYEKEDGTVLARYNSVEYLASRHGLHGAPQLDIIRGALQGLVEGATGGEVQDANPNQIDFRQGIEKRRSAFSFEETYSRLRDAIDTNPNLRIVTEIDHAANAAGAGLELNPTRLIIFGNPLVGTPFMQAQQSIGIDLPQKMLVIEDEEGKVQVAFNSINWLARHRHGISEEDARIQAVTNALRGLARTATTR